MNRIIMQIMIVAQVIVLLVALASGGREIKDGLSKVRAGLRGLEIELEITDLEGSYESK